MRKNITTIVLLLKHYRKGEDVMVNNLKLMDAQEGISSFVEKRKPRFEDH